MCLNSGDRIVVRSFVYERINVKTEEEVNNKCTMSSPCNVLTCLVTEYPCKICIASEKATSLSVTRCRGIVGGMHAVGTTGLDTVGSPRIDHAALTTGHILVTSSSCTI